MASGGNLEGLILAEADKFVSAEIQKAHKEFGVWQHNTIKETFNKSVTAFYNDYEATSYIREGDTESETGGLYDLYALGEPESGTIIPEFPDDYSNLYDAANMHAGRKGYNGLFHLVFEEGYHGGAKKISPAKAKIWQPHPNPGVPYVRIGGFYEARDGRRRWHPYARWGWPAEKSTPIKDTLVTNMGLILPEMMEELANTEQKHLYSAAEKLIPNSLQYILDEIRW